MNHEPHDVLRIREARAFGGRLTQSQIDGMTAILDEWDRRKLLDKRWLAYMLATTFHETAATMQPIRERGGEKYLRGKAYYPWVGEGLVQVTWEENHRKFGATKPGQLLKMPIAIKALFDGMTKGMFTKRKLADYFNQTTDDPVNARRIVNGTDKAKLIAGYYRNFLDALEAARDVVEPADVEPEAAKPDDVPATQSKSLWTILLTLFPGLGSFVFLEKIDNVFALGAFALVLVAVCVGAWLVFTGRVTINRGRLCDVRPSRLGQDRRRRGSRGRSDARAGILQRQSRRAARGRGFRPRNLRQNPPQERRDRQ
ncbi:chitinase [Sinorhizobium psoraleae]|uniref:Chitinase n=1 Tax=Sinorhizobium psoraleae TaxID=520838 RepID=A0ABT4KM44_9HYPH|nr:chitinase [Sinorhizobium psoraleae]MCZ4093038.1 chitinase [Sinorhizobium psoraleae]